MISIRILRLLSLCMLFAICCRGERSDSADQPPRPPPARRPASPEPPTNRLVEAHGDMVDVSRHIMETQLNFPEGFIQPVFGYHPDYTDLIENHVRHPDTRFVRVAPELGHGEIYATPWTVVRPGETELKRGFLMINFWQNRYNPMIHTGFREEHLPGSGENAWEYINRVATVTPEEIRQRFGDVRFIGLP